MRGLLRERGWPAVGAAGTLLPDAVGRYFEGLESERGIVRRCADSLLLMRALVGAGTPRALGDLRLLWLIVNDRLLLLLLAAQITESTGAGTTTPAALAVVTLAPDDGALSTDC